MAEEPHDDGQRNALLVEVHGFGFAKHVAVNVLRDGGAVAASESAPCLSTAETVSTESAVG